MSDKLFSKYELYDLVNAEDSALAMENVTGVQSGWYEFASEEEYNERLQKLECGEEQFESDLRETASALRDNFEDLLNLNEEEFETIEEFEIERSRMEETILNYIQKKLKNYCKEA